MNINIEEIISRFEHERIVLQTEHEQMFIKLARVQVNVLHFLSQFSQIEQPRFDISQETPCSAPITYLGWRKDALYVQVDIATNFINFWCNDEDSLYFLTHPHSIAIPDDEQFEVPADIKAFLEKHFKA